MHRRRNRTKILLGKTFRILGSTLRHSNISQGQIQYPLKEKILRQFLKNDYMVALKTDGVRYILLMTTKPNSTEPISLMIDRTLKMYEIEIWASEEYYFRGCLLEGELVWDNNKNLNYIIFDVVMLKGLKCNDMNYRNRLDVIQNHIFSADDTINDETLEKMLSEEDKFCARNNNYNLQIQPKMCVSKHEITTVWDGRQMCSHKNDGLIFTMNDLPVHTGTSKYIFKWKPCHTIDIKFKFNEYFTLWANDNSSNTEVDITNSIGNYAVELKDSQLTKMFERKKEFIIECIVNLNSDNKVILTPERERLDKVTANTIKTMLATILNVKENIQVQELITLHD